jgi:methylase of polypeptide subunit release factors
MSASHPDIDALSKVGRYFRQVGLDDVIEFERRNQSDRYEPWLETRTQLSGEAADLYRILHSGESIRLSDSKVAASAIDALAGLNLLEINVDVIARGKWKLTHFRDLFCVADVEVNRPSAVYVGDDSFIFADFLASLPSAEVGLDIGSGSGISTAAMAKTCRLVTGIDLVNACVDAGNITASLNGCHGRARFHSATLEEYCPEKFFDVVAANPPGVPIPRNLNYGVAGHGGESGLDLVMSFLNASVAFCKRDGTLAMRFQSLARSDEILAHSAILALARAKHWDLRLIVDIRIPVEVRSALTARNALALNPQLTEGDILGLLDAHMRRIGATAYTSTLLLARLNGAGRTSIQAVHNALQLDTRLRPAGGRGHMDDADVALVLSHLVSLLGNAPGISWRICNSEGLAAVLSDFGNLCRVIYRSESVREALQLLWPDAISGSSISSRGRIIPALLAAESLIRAGYLCAEA